MKRSPLVLACILAAALTAAAVQQPASAPQTPPSLVTEVQNSYNNLKGNIIKAMAQFPEDKLTWQPTPEVRSWARLLAHIADGNNGSCSALAGVGRPSRLDSEDTPNSKANSMTKAELEKAVNDSFALCDKAFAAVNETNMLERIGNRSKIFTLMYNVGHMNEHYGNMVTYMRLNGMVPPSTAARMKK